MSDVCAHVLESSLSVSAFVEEIIMFCEKNECNTKLQTAMKQIGMPAVDVSPDSHQDPTLEKFKDYLIATCAYYNRENNLKQLLLWQLFMKDYARSALTCIKLFMEDTSCTNAQRLEYLNQAKVGVRVRILTSVGIFPERRKVF